MTDFPRIPKPHIRSRLFDNRFYAPTYLLLAEELKKEPLPFKLKSTNSVVGKGKAREDPEFDKEREWVLLKVAELATEHDAAFAASVNEQEYEDSGEGIECGCCFSGYPFVCAQFCF
jgi:TRIAD3 protein (E3 ubiquitin-protein ligase RNF216)